MSPHRTSGVATVMFTDLEASTDTTTRLGDEAAAAFFATHDRIVREQFEEHGGRRVSPPATASSRSSTRRAARSRARWRSSASSRRSEDGPRVRIGINAGEVREDEGELFGAAINLAARVMDRADGGEILVTDDRAPARGHDARRAVPRPRPRRAQGLPRAPAAAPGTRRRGQAAPLPRAPRREAAPRAVAAAALVLAAGGRRGGRSRPRAASEPPTCARTASRSSTPARAGWSDRFRSACARPTSSPAAARSGSPTSATTRSARSARARAASRRRSRRASASTASDPGPSGLWVADNERATARVIDPDFGNVAQHAQDRGRGHPGPRGPRPVAVTADAVWISYGYGEIARVDPDGRNRIVERFPIGNDPSARRGRRRCASGSATAVDGTVTRIDPRTNEVVEPIPVGQGASGLAVGAGGVWVRGAARGPRQADQPGDQRDRGHRPGRRRARRRSRSAPAPSGSPAGAAGRSRGSNQAPRAGDRQGRAGQQPAGRRGRRRRGLGRAPGRPAPASAAGAPWTS